MQEFFSNNLGTLFVALLVASAVFAIVRKLIRDRRDGKCVGCDSGCASCDKCASVKTAKQTAGV